MSIVVSSPITTGPLIHTPGSSREADPMRAGPSIRASGDTCASSAIQIESPVLTPGISTATLPSRQSKFAFR